MSKLWLGLTLSGMLTGGAAVGFVAGRGTSKPNPDGHQASGGADAGAVADAKKDASDAKKEAGEARKEATSARQDTSALRQQVDSLKMEQTGTRDQMSTVQRDLDGLKREHEGAKTEQNDLKRDQMTMQQDLQAVRTEVRNMPQAVSEDLARARTELTGAVEQKAADVRRDVSALDAKVGELNKNLDTKLGEHLAAVRAETSALAGKVEEIAREVTEVRKRQEALSPQEQDELKWRVELERLRKQQRERELQKAAQPWDVKTLTAYRFSSMLFRDPLDNNLASDILDENDFAGDAGVSLAYRLFDVKVAQLWLSNDFAQASWFDEENFNRTSDRAGGRLHLSPADAFGADLKGGVTYTWVDTEEYVQSWDAEGALETAQGWLTLRGSYRFANNEYKFGQPDLVDRDGRAHAATLSAIARVDEAYSGRPVLFTLGVSREAQRTDGNDFDRQGFRYFGSVEMPLLKEANLVLDVAWVDTDYAHDDSVDPAARERKDDVAILGVRFNLPLHDNASATVRFEYQNHRSNIGAFDYETFTVLGGPELRF